MLKVYQVHKSAIRVESITVTLENVTDESDHDLAAAAMAAAHETSDSLFGSTVTRFPGGTAVIRLHRD